MRARRGLTLVELLVILFLLGLLLMILLPSLSKSRAESTRATCAASLKGMGATFAIYAAQWHNALPIAGDAGKEEVWLTDETLGVRALMMGQASTERVIETSAMKSFYCVRNMPVDMEKRWQHGEVSVWGFAVMNDRGKGAVNMPVLPERKGVPLRYYLKMTEMEQSAEVELALDVIVSDKAGVGANFDEVTGGARPEMVYSTNHREGGKALGANVLCMDGHVEWRPFEMGKAVAVKQGGAGAAFMWVVGP